MNKYEDGLKTLLHEINFPSKECDVHFGEAMRQIAKAEKDLQELVDKATPKKPIVQTFKSPYLKSYINKGFCPQCNQEVEEDNCCSNNDCRQAIDWSTDNAKQFKKEG